MKAYQNLDTSNVWGNTGTYNGLYHNYLSYDDNGNILTQLRADHFGNVFDSLTYHYNVQSGLKLQNRLYSVTDTIAGSVDGITNDLRNQHAFNDALSTINNVNNYHYTAMGELAKDDSGKIDTIIWTNNGKLWKIKKHNGDSLAFVYDPLGNRVQKVFIPVSGNYTITYYTRDAQGNILAIYSKAIIGLSARYDLIERDIYGSKRLGSDNTPVNLVTSLPATIVDTFSRYLGYKNYELDNHLGNVLTTISDRKILRPDVTLSYVDHYEADILTSQDYYPFGWDEPGRSFNNASYRYGFNGMLDDNEIKGEGNSFTTFFREFDPRLGKWWTIDPKVKSEQSPYVALDDNPISLFDPSGDETDGQNHAPKNTYHKVEKGENCSVIAKMYDITLDALYAANPGLKEHKNLIKPGQTYKIPNHNKNSNSQPVATNGLGGTLNPSSSSPLQSHTSDWSGAVLGTAMTMGEKTLYSSESWLDLKTMTNFSPKFYGNQYTFAKSTMSKVSTGLKWGGYAFGVYNMFSIESRYKSGEYNGYQRWSEQVNNGISTVTGLYGCAWSIGRELGRTIVNTDWYQNWKQDTWLPWREKNLGY